MTKTSRGRYTLEFKQVAVRLVEAGQSIAAAARTLGVVDLMLPRKTYPIAEGQIPVDVKEVVT